MTAIITSRRTFLKTCGLATAAVAGALTLPAVPVVLADATRRDAVDVSDAIAQMAVQAVAAVQSDKFGAHRDQVASSVAGRVGLDAAAMQQAWARADTDHQLAILTGLTQLGVPYRRNTSKPGVGFDCSGLTTYAWGGAGYELTRQSSAQIRQAAARTIETAQPGDLMQYPGHIMMWLGVDRAVLQSPNPGRTVEIVLYKKGRIVRVGDPTG